MDEAKPKRRRRLVWIVVILAVGLLAVQYHGAWSSKEAVLTEAIAGVEGPTVYHFFTNYCPACKVMKPAMEKVVADCTGSGVEFKIVNLESSLGSPLGDQFKVKAIPTTVFVGADGFEKERYVGAISRRVFEGRVESLTGNSCG